MLCLCTHLVTFVVAQGAGEFCESGGMQGGDQNVGGEGEGEGKGDGEGEGKTYMSIQVRVGGGRVV